MQKIINIIISKQIVIFFSLLFLSIVIFDDYLIDSVTFSIISAFGIGVFIYKAYDFFIYLFMKKKSNLSLLDTTAVLFVVSAAVFFKFYDTSKIKENSETISSHIAMCVKNSEECHLNENKIKIKHEGGAIFSVSMGINTILVRTAESNEGCIKVSSIYVGNLIDEIKCF